MRNAQELFMYALMPDDKLRQRLETERSTFADQYDTHKALKNPIHITLVPPFHYGELETNLIDRIEPVAKNNQSFNVTLSGYGSFQRAAVFYVNVKLDEPLKQFQASLKTHFKEVFPDVQFRAWGDFNPHITFGYRDLEPKMLRKAVKDYQGREFHANWPVDSFYLWKLINHRWEVQHEFMLRA